MNPEVAQDDWEPGDPLFNRRSPWARGFFGIKKDGGTFLDSHTAARWTPKTGWIEVED